MRNQSHYIINAVLLLLAAFVVSAFIAKIAMTPPSPDSNAPPTVIDYFPEDPVYSAGADGKLLFNSHCASCHNIFKDATGPALMELEERGPWMDRSNIYAWIKNPAAFMARNAYTRELKKQYGSLMIAFPDLTHKQIDAILAYIGGTRKAVY